MTEPCPTHAVCPNCREGAGHYTYENGYRPTIESEAAKAALGPWGFCPWCGDWCVLEVHGVAACGENR